LAQRPWFVQNPDDEDLARRVPKPGSVEGTPCSVGAVGDKTDEGFSAPSRHLKCLDVHRPLAEHLPETRQGARRIREDHCELGRHLVSFSRSATIRSCSGLEAPYASRRNQ
jgi:hypothetical protein